jgi:hypothetical protein
MTCISVPSEIWFPGVVLLNLQITSVTPGISKLFSILLLFAIANAHLPELAQCYGSTRCIDNEHDLYMVPPKCSYLS